MPDTPRLWHTVNVSWKISVSVSFILQSTAVDMRELRKLLPTLLAISPFLILPLAIEGGVRFALPHIPTIKFYVSGYTHADNEDGAKIFEGDPLLGWRMKANLNRVWWEFTTFSTDNRHMRIPSEVQRNSGRRFRIVCLGNSVTFGYRVPASFREAPQDFDHRAQPFPALLQERLLAEHLGQSIEVISMAVPGYSTYHGLNWLRREIGWLDPDLVVVHFGFNDSLLLPQEYEEAFPNEWYRVVARWAVAQSQAAIHFSRWFGAKISSPNPGGQIKLRPGVSSEDMYGIFCRSPTSPGRTGLRRWSLGKCFRNRIRTPSTKF